MEGIKMAVKSAVVITTTGKIREALASALEKAGRGELSAVDGKNMIGLANQITSNMAVELKHQAMQSGLGINVTTFGKVDIGG
jgi:hypothetical protein